MRSHILSLVERYLGKGHFSGDENISVRCPFHKGGEESRPSFSVNVVTGVWHCFTGCGAGTFPKLLKLLGLPSHVIDAELKDIRQELTANREALNWKKKSIWVSRDPFAAPIILPESLLAPYDWCPTKLIEAGFDTNWLKYMDIGYDRTNNRITYPIRDVYGNLAGISGGAAIAGQFPKYKVYQGKYKDYASGEIIPSPYGEWFDEEYSDYAFQNHNYLWNYDNVYPRLFFGNTEQTVIIVEGFKACLWLLQMGWSNTVALMGSSMSDHQRNLLHRIRANIVLFLDNDDAGRKGTDKIAKVLRKFEPGVKIAQYPSANESQPDSLTQAEVAAAIQGAEEYPIWRKRIYNEYGRSSSGREQRTF
jgi:DNA primase